MKTKNAFAASVSVAGAARDDRRRVSAQTDMAALEAAAKAEGQLTVIALPHDWCGYGDVIDGLQGQVSRASPSTS